MLSLSPFSLPPVSPPPPPPPPLLSSVLRHPSHPALTCVSWRSLGTAWVEYSDRSSCEAAIDHFDGGQVDGSTVSVKISVKQPTQRHVPRDVAPPSRRAWGRSSPPRAGGRCVPPAGRIHPNLTACFACSALCVTRFLGGEHPPLPRVEDPPHAAAGGAPRQGDASRHSNYVVAGRWRSCPVLKWNLPTPAGRPPQK